MFRCIIDYKFEGKDQVQKQIDLLKDIGIDEKFSINVVGDIRNKCRELGLNGWVISPFWVSDADETWYNTWYDLLRNGEIENIKEYFKKITTSY